MAIYSLNRLDSLFYSKKEIKLERERRWSTANFPNVALVYPPVLTVAHRCQVLRKRGA